MIPRGPQPRSTALQPGPIPTRSSSCTLSGESSSACRRSRSVSPPPWPSAYTALASTPAPGCVTGTPRMSVVIAHHDTAPADARSSWRSAPATEVALGRLPATEVTACGRSCRRGTPEPGRPDRRSRRVHEVRRRCPARHGEDPPPSHPRRDRVLQLRDGHLGAADGRLPRRRPRPRTVGVRRHARPRRQAMPAPVVAGVALTAVVSSRPPAAAGAV